LRRHRDKNVRFFQVRADRGIHASSRVTGPPHAPKRKHAAGGVMDTTQHRSEFDDDDEASRSHIAEILRIDVAASMERCGRFLSS